MWREFARRVAWTPPTGAEVAVVLRAGLAASLAWLLAVAVTDATTPVLAPLAALITTRVSVNASVRSALERSAGVVLGVLLAVALGDLLGLNVWTVGLLTTGSFAIALLVFRLPRPAAQQVPVSALVVMAALAAGEEAAPGARVIDTLLGAAVGVAVSLALPASRVGDARTTIRNLGTALGDLLDSISAGLEETWDTTQTAEWRHTARITRQRLVNETSEAVGNGREAAQWNLRDRSHVPEITRYEDEMPRLERTAIGVWAIARGLEDHAQLTGGEHREMPAMAALLKSLGDLIRTFVDEELGAPHDGGMGDGGMGDRGVDEGSVDAAVEELLRRRAPCAEAALRQTQIAPAPGEPARPEPTPGEWMSYTALLVQVDRIVDDLR